MKIRHILGFIWCLPISILFWVLGLFLLITKQIEKFKVNDDLIFLWDLKNEGWFCKKAFGARGWGGFSCGNNIVVVDSDTARWKRSVKHERRHCYQQYIFGIIFPVLYLLNSLFIYVFYPDEHIYLHNTFEVDARRAAGQLIDIPRAKWPDGPNDRNPWW
jgi:hypothetical protein